MIELFFWLCAMHALLDYPLQGDFLAKAKNASAPIPGVPWWQALTAHALIQSAGVLLLTGNAWFALGEFIIHWTTDHAKCRGRIGFNMDQGIHIACKGLWAVLAFA